MSPIHLRLKSSVKYRYPDGVPQSSYGLILQNRGYDIFLYLFLQYSNQTLINPNSQV